MDAEYVANPEVMICAQNLTNVHDIVEKFINVQLKADRMFESSIASSADSDPSARGFTDIDRAVELIIEELAQDPSAAATLLPGFTIRPMPMTPAMRAKLFLPGATEKRRSNNEKRLLKVWKVVDDQLARNPYISDFDLAAELNCAGLQTYTKLPFVASKVRILLKQRQREAETVA